MYVDGCFDVGLLVVLDIIRSCVFVEVKCDSVYVCICVRGKERVCVM